MPRAKTKPPRTAVILVDLRRHRATTIVANSIDVDQLQAPSQPRGIRDRDREFIIRLIYAIHEDRVELNLLMLLSN